MWNVCEWKVPILDNNFAFTIFVVEWASVRGVTIKGRFTHVSSPKSQVTWDQFVQSHLLRAWELGPLDSWYWVWKCVVWVLHPLYPDGSLPYWKHKPLYEWDYFSTVFLFLSIDDKEIIQGWGWPHITLRILESLVTFLIEILVICKSWALDA